MKVLIISESVPFPPLNGRELPIAGLFSHISLRHDVHLLVLTENAQKVQDKKSALPSTIHLLGILKIKKWSLKKRVLHTIKNFRHSLSPYNYSADDIKRITGDNLYDFVWISPVLFYGFAIFCMQHNLYFFKKIAIGLNDVKTYLYRDGMNEIIHTGIFNKTQFAQWLLSFIMYREEKNYLKFANLVHVQTDAEYIKAKRILPPDTKTIVVAASNGIKKELFNCTGNGIACSNKILFMTHLDGGRSGESAWFIQKVWPLITQQLPDAVLLIAGKPPAKPLPYLQNRKDIVINGYVPDLLQVFESVRLVVVPTFHGTGLINRIADALAAGLPVVSTPQAIATFPGLQHNIHIVEAGNAQSFAKAVAMLFNDIDMRMAIGKQGREFARHFPDWQTSAGITEKAMEEVLLS